MSLSTVAAEVPSTGHLLQFYQDEECLYMAVGEFLARDTPAVVIAPEAHLAGFRKALTASGIDVESALETERLVLLDADQVLARFMVGGWPNDKLFHNVVGGLVKKMTRLGTRPILAHGEMVDLLFQRGQYEQALRLETLWNELGTLYPFTLMCAYCVDALDVQQADRIRQIAGCHTHVQPSQDNGRLDDALDQALRETLGDNGAALRALLHAYPPKLPTMPAAFAALMWLQKSLPEVAVQIVERTKELYYAPLKAARRRPRLALATPANGAPSGLPSVGPVPWGSHCNLFYHDKRDVVDTFLPFLKAGLQNHERCIWVAGQPLGASEAAEHLMRAVPDMATRLKQGQLTIYNSSEWLSANTNERQALARLLEIEARSQSEGWAGVRIAMTVSVLPIEVWTRLTLYEAALHELLPSRRVLALCAYPDQVGGVHDTFDVLNCHHFAVVRRQGQWRMLQFQSTSHPDPGPDVKAS